MSEPYFALTDEDRRQALEAAAHASGRPDHLLEKDIWVVWTLHQLFTAKVGEHLVFKGGTSLSKVHRVIDRFSEDIDLTWDIRAIIPERIAKAGGSPLPPNTSQAGKWTNAVRERLPQAIHEQVVPYLDAAIQSAALPARVEMIGGDKVLIHFEPISRTGSGYMQPRVQLEFGARATGEPYDVRAISCDAAAYLEEVDFPAASVKAMRAERTFWEKVTAVHVYCLQGAFRGESHFSRHWYDLVQLDRRGIVDRALADHDLARAVAEHKNLFFIEKAGGQKIDYIACVTGQLRLVPDGDALMGLREDYAKMMGDGYLPEEAETFQELLEHCRDIEMKARAILSEQSF